MKENNKFEYELYDDRPDIQIPVEELPQEEILEEAIETEISPNFYENSADKLDIYQRKSIATSVMEGIEADLKSRSGWEQILANGIKLMGLSSEEKNNSEPDSLLLNMKDPLMLRAWLSFMGSRHELYPQEGIADYKIDGPSTEQIEQSSEKRINFLNHYLYVTDKGYKSDCARKDASLCISGNAFKKVWKDPVSGMPISRFIKPENMILDNNAESLEDCPRKTEVIYLTKKQISERVKKGFYIEHRALSDMVDDSMDSMKENPINIAIRDIYGIEDNYDKKTLFRYFETHCNLDEDFLMDLEGMDHDDGGLPYIVHICSQTNELVGLYRGWEETKKDYSEGNCFTHEQFIPGFGLYAFGYAHVLAVPTATLTAITNMLLHAGQLANFPALLMLEGRRKEHATQSMEPTEIVEVPNLGMPIRDVVSPLPYKEPSIVLKDLGNEIRAQWQSIDMGLDSKIADQSGNAPVGTTMAMMEVQGRMQSMIVRSILDGMAQELRMIDAIFKDSFGDEPLILYTNGIKLEISKEDYYDNVTIIPACSPDISSSIHKIMINDAIVRTMAMNPTLFNQHEVFKRFLESIKTPDIDSILPPPQEAMALDPLSENANALQSKPLKAEKWQDHRAHIIVHQSILQRPEVQQNPILMESMMAHISVHNAMEYILQMEKELGMTLPDMNQLQNPQIQNSIAAALVPIVEQQHAIEQQEKPLDPTAVMVMDVEQRAEASKLKAEIDKMRIELEAYKAQLDFEKEKSKIEADLEIAEDRNETNLEIEHLKHEENENG